MRISDCSSDVCSSDLAADFNEARGQMIVPLAFGGDTGRHMAATDAVRPLTQTPERPQIALTATLGRGDSFARLLERTGVGRREAKALATRVSDRQTVVTGQRVATRVAHWGRRL